MFFVKGEGKRGDGRHCDLCGCSTPTVRCDKCAHQIFCLSCDDMYHRHPKRQSHVRKVGIPYEFSIKTLLSYYNQFVT